MIFMKINFKNLNFDQLILVKIIQTAATRQHILKLKFTKFDFSWGLLRGKRSFGLHARRWYGQQRPTDMVVHRGGLAHRETGKFPGGTLPNYKILKLQISANSFDTERVTWQCKCKRYALFSVLPDNTSCRL